MISTIKHLYSSATGWPFVWIKDIRLETVKLLEKKKHNGNLDIVLSNDLVFFFFLGMISRAQAIKPKIDKWGYIKLKILSTTKDITSK